jgi:hypothetical protein
MERLSLRLSALGVLLLAAACGIAGAQIPVWGASFDAPGVSYGWDEAVAIKATPDTCMVVTGFMQADTGTLKHNAIHTIKYRCADGSVVWERTWELLPGGVSNQAPAALGVDASGMIFITGWTYAAATGTDTDMVTLKYEPDGTLAWAAVYDWVNFADAGAALVPDRMGGVYVAGRTYSVFNSDILTIHYSSAGDTLWRFRKNSFNGHDWATAISLSPAGTLFTAAVCWRAPSNSFDYYTIKFDTSLAAHAGLLDTSGYLWIKVYDGLGGGGSDGGTDIPVGILTDSLDNSWVCGTAKEGVTGYDITTVRYAADGTQLWVNRFDAGYLNEDNARCIVQGPGGRVYCGGNAYDEFSYDLLFYPIDDVGGVPYVPWYVKRDYLTLDDTVSALAVDPAGNLYVAGAGIEGDRGTFDWLLYKYTPDGVCTWWTDTGNFELEDVPNALALDQQGDPYVAGVFETYDSSYNQSWMTIKYSEKDVGVLRVAMPDDSFRVGARFSPKAWVRSYSAATLHGVDVTFAVPGQWYRSFTIDSLMPYESLLVTFSSKTFEPSDAGTHAVTCYTALVGDADFSNDTVYSQLTVVPGWERLADVPRGPREKEVKDGGCVAWAWDSLVYAFKGNNLTEFYSYRIADDTWFTMESIPYEGRDVRKRVKTGSRLAPDTANHVYAFKGNNCLDFWRYTAGDSMGLGSWFQLTSMPPGSGKKIKGGSSLIFVPSRNAFYAAKGNNTDEFYSYSVASGGWTSRRAVIPGERGYKVKEGSAMAYDGNNSIYLIKGNSLELYRYKISADSWYQSHSIGYSINDPKRRKFKKGSGLVYDEVNNRLIAAKGGKATELWYFDITPDTWLELPAGDMIPVPYGTKPPYGGADLTCGKGKVYTIKGNKSFEFWRYNADLPFSPGLPGPGPMAAGVAAVARLEFSVAPNPFSTQALVRYTLPQAGRVRLVLYDVMGRVARVAADEWQMPGWHALSLEAEGLARGVYLARLQASNEVFTVEATKKVLLTQ